MEMIWVMNAYSGDKEWVKRYSINAIFYDKKEKNVGYNMYDYMDYIVNHYDTLPRVILFGKTNMLERHITEVEFNRLVKNRTFTPLLTQNHKVYDPVCWYEDGIYCEVNDYWYLREHPTKTVNSFNEITKLLGMDKRTYNKFAPGGCYIVPKENILQHPKSLYEKLRDSMEWTEHPGEAFLIERSLYHLWTLPH